MIDFWRSIAEICLNPDFHTKCFDGGKAPVDETEKFVPVDLLDHLTGLESLLRQVAGLVICREDIMVINYMVRVQGAYFNHLRKPVLSGSPPSDDIISTVRKNVGAINVPTDATSRAIFGLMCIDGQFREDLRYSALRLDDIQILVDFLAGKTMTGLDRGPNFGLPRDYDYQYLRDIASVGILMKAMEDFAVNKWEQPYVHLVYGGCSKSYTMKHYQPMIDIEACSALGAIKPDPVASSAAHKFYRQLSKSNILDNNIDERNKARRSMLEEKRRLEPPTRKI